MKKSHGFLAVLIAAAGCVSGQSAVAQQAASPDPVAVLGQQIEAIGQGARSRTEFVLDRPMIQLAGRLANQDDPATRRVLAGLNFISVHSYSFREPGDYSPMDLETIRREYHEAGWQHLVSTKPRMEGTALSDLWIHFRGTEVTDISVLLSGPTQLHFLQFDGTLRPLDLMHLSGHFGIPRFNDEGMVPAPENR